MMSKNEMGGAGDVAARGCLAFLLSASPGLLR